MSRCITDRKARSIARLVRGFMYMYVGINRDRKFSRGCMNGDAAVQRGLGRRTREKKKKNRKNKQGPRRWSPISEKLTGKRAEWQAIKLKSAIRSKSAGVTSRKCAASFLIEGAGALNIDGYKLRLVYLAIENLENRILSAFYNRSAFWLSKSCEIAALTGRVYDGAEQERDWRAFYMRIIFSFSFFFLLNVYGTNSCREWIKAVQFFLITLTLRLI